MNNEKERKRKWRAEIKKDQAKYEKYKEGERLRKWAAKKKKKANDSNAQEVASDSASSTPCSAFSCKQSLHRSLSRADLHLPKSPNKKAEIIQRLATKYNLRVDLKENRGRRRKELSDEEKMWLIEFLNRSDISYTNPGRKDNVYIGKFNGESKYKQRQYLLWPLRDLILMANGTEEMKDSFVLKFEKKLTFSQFYDFLKRHKEYVYNTNIPHSSCLCEICENASLFAKGLNSQRRKLKGKLPTNPHELIEMFSCNSDEADCMLENCCMCKSSKLIDELIVDHPSESESSEESNSSDGSSVSNDPNDSEDQASEQNADKVIYYRWQTVDKKITKARIEIGFNNAIEMFKEEVAVLKEHIHIKRRQVNAYREMKESLTNDDLMVQVDFAESYKNEHQNAIQSAYFGNQCFSIFTACCYSKVSEKIKNDNVIIVTERSEHDRVASMSCLQKVVQEIESKYSKSYKNLYVWSDGMGAQFRSRFVFKLLAGTVLPNKSLAWFYNERHHGKGPMDGIGGTVKNVVFRKVKSGQVMIYSPREFCEAVNSFIPSILAAYLPETENIVEPRDIEASKRIKNTLKIHKLERRCNQNGDIYINFFKIADDKEPFHVQWYGEENEIICGHDKTSDSDGHCQKCEEEYNEGEEWLRCPVCNYWFHEKCFYE